MIPIRKLLIAASLAVLLLPRPSVADGFQVATDKEGLRKFGNDPFFSELAVGDEAYVHISSLCLEGTSLQLVSNTEIGTLSEYGYNLKLRREVNNSVTGQIVAGKSANLSRKASWFSDFGNLYQCRQVAALVPFEPTFLRVLSIDGFTDLKVLMRSHFDQ